MDRLTPEEYKKLNWNDHTCVMFLDNYFLISGHLNSKKAQNEENVKDLVSIMPVIIEKFSDFEIISGLDANSFIKPFNEKIYMFPDIKDIFTTVKKRTSMQVQTLKAETLVKENKDAIMTTLPIREKKVFTIAGNEPTDTNFLPLDDHPFDHYLVFVIVDDGKHL